MVPRIGPTMSASIAPAAAGAPVTFGAGSGICLLVLLPLAALGRPAGGPARVG